MMAELQTAWELLAMVVFFSLMLGVVGGFLLASMLVVGGGADDRADRCLHDQ